MHFLTTGTEQVSRSDWEAKSQGMVCMSYNDWVNTNKEIGSLCSQVPCSYKEELRRINQEIEKDSVIQLESSK